MVHFDTSIFRGITSKQEVEKKKSAGEHPPRMVLNRRESRRQNNKAYQDSLAIDYSFAMRPNTPLVERSETMPADLYDDQANEIKRTGSGGLMFFRKRSTFDQQKKSQTRALELIENYELSDEKNTILNKNAQFTPASTILQKFSAPCQTNLKEQAAMIVQKLQNKENKASTPSPLLNSKESNKPDQTTTNQTLGPQRYEVATNRRENKADGITLRRTPLRPKQATTVNISDDAYLKAKAVQAAHKEDDADELGNLGVEIVMDLQGRVTLLPSPTGVEAIAPSARAYFYQAPSGRLFDIPNLC